MNGDVYAQSVQLSGGRSPYRYYCSEQLNLYVNSSPSAFASVDSYLYLNTGDLNYSLASIWSRNNPPYTLQVNGPVFAFDVNSNILLKL